MITNGLLMIAVVCGLAAVLLVLDKTAGWKFFRYVPAVVLMYLLCAALNSAGLFGTEDATREPLKNLKDFALPAMIFLLLLGCDLRRILSLGPKLLLTYAITSLSLLVGIVVAFLAFRAALDPEAWKALAALLGSWTGGSANMAAVQDILQAPENIFGYALITDTIVYSLWLMIVFSSVMFSDRFNRFTRADTSYLNAHMGAAEHDDRPVTVPAVIGLILGSLLIAWGAITVGEVMPEVGEVMNSTAWTILLVSVLGLIAAQTPLGRIPGSQQIATVLLFVVIGQIASGSDFSALTEAPVYLVAGVTVLVVHAVIMLIYAKLTRTELFSLAVASVANVGGIASAPVVAGAFNRQLVPVGVLFALIGSLMGTWIGLLGGQIMSGL